MRITRWFRLFFRVTLLVGGTCAILFLVECTVSKSPRESGGEPEAVPAGGVPLGAPLVRSRYGLAKPIERAPGSIRIATYNVLFLFDDVDDPALDGAWDDLPMATTDERCRAIAATIRAIDADILALHEVESLECLTWFRDTYLADAGYEHLGSVEVGYFRGYECSVMSRFPISNVRTWETESLDDVKRSGPWWSEVPEESKRGLRYQRSPLCMDVHVNAGYELTLFVLHQKAWPQFDYHREAEAIRTVELIDEVRSADPSRNIVVLGDLNAEPSDKSVRVYFAAGLIDTLAHRSVARGKKNEPMESDLYVTYEFGLVLDYILLNSAAHRELVVGSAHVFGTLFDRAFDSEKDPYPAGYASDHYPVIIDLVPRDEM